MKHGTLRVLGAFFSLISLSLGQEPGCEVHTLSPPQISQSTIQGSLRITQGAPLNLTNGATITGDLILPGTPAIESTASPEIGPVASEGGPVDPTGYVVGIHGDVSVGGILTQSVFTAFPPATSPSLPAGTRTVVLKKASDDPGDFATILDLTLHNNYGSLALPAGVYGHLKVKKGSTLQLGIAGATTPTVYEVQSLSLDNQAALEVLGPVELRLKNSFNPHGTVGNEAHPEWLALGISDGGLHVNHEGAVFGGVIVPNGTVTLNGNSILKGSLAAKDLRLHGGSTIICVETDPPVNTAPIAQDDNYQTNRDAAIALTLQATDPESDPLTWTIVTPPGNGTLTGTAPNLSYQPASGFVGTDQFTFRVSDGALDSNLATVTLQVLQVNRPPVANDLDLELNQGEADAPVTLTGFDPDNDPLTFTVLTNPAFGTLTGTAPNLFYTHTGERTNTPYEDSFTYQISDSNNGLSAIATVRITLNPVNRPPAGEDLTLTLNEDGFIDITLPLSDPDGDDLTFTLADTSISALTFGEVVLPDGTPLPSLSDLPFTPGQATLRYVTSPDVSGTDTFEFTVSDGSFTAGPFTITLHITPVNDAPVATDSSIATSEDTAAAVTLAGTDIDSATLVLTVQTPPAHGTLSGTSPNLVYTPDADFFGTDSFTFLANDGALDSLPATVSISVSAVNDPPEVAALSLVTDEETPLPVSLTGTDVEGDALAFVIVTPPSNGSLTGTSPNFTYTPALNFDQVDSFTFIANDGTADSAPATVTIAVTSENDAPVATPLALTLAEDSTQAFTLSGTDPESSPLTFTILSGPDSGSITGTPPNLTYQPDADFNGSDTLTYLANDGELDSAPATVSFTITSVNDAPVASALTVDLSEDTQADISLSGTDVDGDTLSWSIISGPDHGVLAGSGPLVTYLPDPNFNGSDTFTFVVDDGELSSTPTTVTLNVASVNDPPVVANITVSLTEDTLSAFTLTGSDPDGDPISFTITSPPGSGTLTGEGPDYTYQPQLNFDGTDTLTFTATDGALNSDTGTVTFEITPVNDAPVADTLSVTLQEDNPAPFSLTGFDVEGDPLVFQIVTSPANGTIAPDPNGSLGDFIYTPNPNFSGTDSLVFLANDGALDSAHATLTFTITSINDTPVGTPLDLTLAEDSAINFSFTATDEDNDPLTFFVLTQPTHGTLSGTSPNYTYTPDADYFGTDAFTYAVSDGTETSDPVSVDLTITAVNDPPVANPDALTLAEDGSLALTLSGSDVENDPLTFAIVSPPANGTLTGTAPNLTYTPAPNFNGTDSLSFTVSDGTVTSETATVSLTITPVNDLPTANPASFFAVEDTPLPFTLTGTDPDGDPLTFLITLPPINGTITGTSPNFLYTPNANYNGPELFGFVAFDGTGNSAPAFANILISAVNDTPTADDLAVTTLEDNAVAVNLVANDVDGDPLTYTIVTPPSYGALSGTAPNLTYIPNANYHGPDSLVYLVNDGTVDSLPATVSLSVNAVNDPPEADDFTVVLNEDSTASVFLTGSDAEGSPLTYSILTPPTNGTLTGTAPNLTYTPDPDFNGTDSLTYLINDGTTDSTPVTVTLAVSSINDRPVIAPLAFTGPENQDLAIDLVVTDADGDTPVLSILSAPANGTLSGTLPNLVFSPFADYRGVSQLTVSADDGTAVVTETIILTITEINVAPLAYPVAAKATGTTTAVPLAGVDENGDALTFVLKSNPAVGSATITGSTLTYTGPDPLPSRIEFTYAAFDGDLESAPAAVRISPNTPPTVAVTSPGNGARLAQDEAVSVTAVASDPDGTIVSLALLIDGQRVHQVSESPSASYSWIPETTGSHTLQAVAIDGDGCTTTSAAVTVVVSGGNEPPVVSAGSDQEAGSLDFGPNLIVNPGNEFADTSGEIAGWTRLNGAPWVQGQEDTRFRTGFGSTIIPEYPPAYEGDYFFAVQDQHVTTGRIDGALAQIVDLAAYAAAIDAGSQRLLFRCQARTPLFQPSGNLETLDRASVSLAFFNATGDPLGEESIEAPRLSTTWLPLSALLAPPAGTRSLQVILHAENKEYATDVLFDEVQLRASSQSVPFTLQGSVSDDGLPVGDSLAIVWTQLTGPTVSLSNPASPVTDVTFTDAGTYAFRLTAHDGEFATSDTVSFTVGAGGNNAPPSVDLGEDLSVSHEAGEVLLTPTVFDDGVPDPTLQFFWEKVSGPGAVAFSTPETANTGFTIVVPGDYILRLTADDGQLSGSDEVSISVTCEAARPPLDVYLVIDHTGSMFGPSAGVNDEMNPATPIYQARVLANAIIDQLDPAIDMVSIAKNSGNPTFTADRGVGLTDDFDLARSRIVLPLGEPQYFGDAGSQTQNGLVAIRQHIVDTRRPGAQQVLIHIGDGACGPGSGSLLANHQNDLINQGTSVILVVLPNLQNDPIDEEDLKVWASTPAHILTADEPDPGLYQEILSLAASVSCINYNLPPDVFAGTSRQHPSLAVPFVPGASFQDDGQPAGETTTFTWSLLDGPGTPVFSGPNSLNPQITFPLAGAYELQLSVSDGELSSTDTLTVYAGGASCTQEQPSGLFAYWPFDSNLRDQVEARLLQSAGFTNDYGFTEGLVGNGLDLRTTVHTLRQTQGASLAQLDTSPDGFALSFWVRPEHSGSNISPTFASFHDNVASERGTSLQYWSGGNYVAFNFFVTESSTTSIRADNVTNLAWNHVVFTYDPATSELKSYTNGVEEESRVTTIINRSHLPLHFLAGLGEGAGSSANSFPGLIDELAFFDRVLTPADVQQLYGLREGLCIPSANAVPVVDAGDHIDLPSSLTTLLAGFVTDDNPDVAISWSVVSGPGTATFADASDPATTVTFSAPGRYALRLSADDGFRTVSDIVEVSASLTCTPAPDGLLSWIPANGHLQDLVLDRTGTSTAGEAAYAAGTVGEAVTFNTTAGYIKFPAATTTAPDREFSYEGWFRVDAASNWTPIVSFRTPVTNLARGGIVYYSGGLAAHLTNANGSAPFPFTSAPMTPGQYYHFAVTTDETARTKIYLDGVQVNSSTFNPDAPNPLTYDMFFKGYPGGASNFEGAIDEFSIYSRALTAAEISAIHAAGPNGKCFPEEAAPTLVNAGPDDALAVDSGYTFAGSVDAGSFASTITLAWTQLSGPDTPTLLAADTLAPTTTFSTAGRYVFQLTATDGTTSASDSVTIDVLANQNAAPSVVLSAPATLQLPDDTVELVATVTDDGFEGTTLEGTWTQLSGPAAVSLYTTTGFNAGATFSAAGIYEFNFTVSDGFLLASDTLSIEVLAEPGTPVNAAPLVSLGADQTLSVNSFTPAPTVSDDGLPTPAALTYQWNMVSGPAGAGVSDAAALTPTFTFPAPGDYTLQLRVSDGALAATDTITLTVPTTAAGFDNEPPTVDPITPQLIALPDTLVSLAANVADDGRSGQALTYSWTQLSGPAATFSDPSALSTDLTLTTPGDYLLQFAVSDGEYLVQLQTTVRLLAQPNLAPVVNAGSDQSATPGGSLTLNATASDDGLPGPGLSYQWSFISAPALPVFSAPTALTTDVTFPTGGTYLLEFSATDGELTTRDYLTITVVGAPELTLLTPEDGSELTDIQPLELHARAYQDGGSITSVEFFKDGSSLGFGALEAGTIDYFRPLSSLPFGFHTITAVATASDGSTVATTSTFEFVDQDESQLTVEILTPEDGSLVSAPTVVTGTVESTRLESWTLEVEPIPATDGARILVAEGTDAVLEDELGTLDPTLLQNGAYRLILTATATTGLIQEFDQTILIEGAMKLGQFTLAFEDLSVPLTGIPITLTRTYDSRDTTTGDFGLGWDLGLKNIRIRTTTTVGRNWLQRKQVQPGFVPLVYFCLESSRAKRVILTFPDGRTEIFEVTPFIPESQRTLSSFSGTGSLVTLPPNCKLYTPISEVQLAFTPVDGSNGILALANPSATFLWNGPAEGRGEIADFSLDALDPTEFRYTEDDGTSYALDSSFGLESVTDSNGNLLTIDDLGIHHSSGEEILFTRDPVTDFITAVTDPAGEQILYGYDAQDRLTSVTNRVGDTTTFHYEEAAYPHYLSRIEDPRGIEAIRTEYDDDGRLEKQIDANGEEIVFVHDLANNREVITDRLGNTTTHEFDAFGNITRTIDALGGETLRTYDAFDNELTTTTPLGFTTTRSFDDQDNLLSEEDPLGNVTSYTYTSDKRPLSISDGLSRTTGLAYTGRGNLDRMTDPTGAATNFGYDGAGNLASLIDAEGTATSYTHDTKGREQSMTVTAADGTVLRSEGYTYDGNGNRLTSTTTRTLPGGGTETLTTTFTYDFENRVTSTTFPDGTSTSVTYNAIGKQETTTDQLNRVTTYAYDDRGNLVLTIYPDNTTMSMVYDAENRAIASTDQLGRTTYSVYDALGRLTDTVFPDETMPASVLTTQADILTALSSGALADNPRSTTEYDADGRVTASIDPNDNRTEFEYDDAGRRTLVRDALGFETVTVYDDAGQQTSVTDAKLHTTGFAYDDAGRLTTTTFHDGTTTTTAYDDLGRRILTTDQNGIPTGYSYDELGRLVAVHQANPETGLLDGGQLITSYTYDEQGNQLTQTDALGRTTSYTYDQLGRRLTRTLPDGQSESIAYNDDGTMDTRTDFNGHTTAYDYDPQTSRLLTVTADAAHPSLSLALAPRSLSFTYDDAGQRLTAATLDTTGTILHQESWTYDARGRNLSKATPHGTLSYSYDLAGNLLTAQSDHANGLMSAHSYDALNRLATTTDNSVSPAYVAGYTYDAVGNLRTATGGNGLTHRYTYSDLNRLTGLGIGTLSDPGNAQSAFSSLKTSHLYTLNNAGHRLQIDHWIEAGPNVGATGLTRAYTYDALYRVQTEEFQSPTPNIGNLSGTLTYTHDAVGNRLTRSASTGTLQALLPNQSQNYNDNDQLTTHTHDANGNTTASPAPLNSSASLESAGLVSSTDTYDFRNKLIRRSYSDGTSIDLEYNADALLIAKTKDSQRAAYLQDTNNHTGYAQIVEELVFNTTSSEYDVFALNVPGHDLLHTHQSHIDEVTFETVWTTHHYLYDGLGSVHALTNDAGDLTDTFHYDAFGSLLSSTGTTPNAYLFTGERFDPDLGFYYLRARYLDPNLGRFHTLDPYQGRNGEPLTLHKYLYAHSDPVNGIDPSGNLTLNEQTAVNAGRLKIASALTNIRLGFAIGRAAGGAALRQLGIVVENAVLRILVNKATVNIIGTSGAAGTVLSGPGGRRIIDFLIRIKDRLFLLEVKFQIPPRAGPALSRLVGQIQTAASQANRTTVVFSYREPTVQQLERVITLVGPTANPVQYVHGLSGLIRWLNFISSVR